MMHTHTRRRSNLPRFFKRTLWSLWLLGLVACGGEPGRVSPNPPSDIRAEPGPLLITVNWAYDGKDVGFDIYRDVQDAEGNTVEKSVKLNPEVLPGDTRSFKDEDVEVGLQYRYALSARGARGASERTELTEAVTPQPASPPPASSYRVNVLRAGNGQGVVTSDPEGISCIQRPGDSGVCRATFTGGKPVTLSAKADAGSSFVGWEGDCKGAAECVLDMDADKNVTATFVSARATVSVVTEGPGKVVSNPASLGIDCGEDCAETLPPGTVIVLNAQPNDSAVFVGWGETCEGTGECRLTLDSDTKVTAKFLEKAPPPRVLSFSADPPTVLPGAETTLSWRVTGAEKLTLKNGDSEQDVTGQTEVTVKPAATTTYTLTASNFFGDDSAELRVQVGTPPVISRFRASDTTLTPGSDVTLSWNVRDASKLTLTGGGGPLDVTGDTSVTLKVSETTTFTLIAENAVGKVEERLEVRVGQAPTIEVFSAAPPLITPGASSTLSWRVRNGNVRLNGDPVDSSGSLSVTPSETTTYTLTATNDFGQSAQEVEVRVGSAPSISTFRTDKSAVAAGGEVTLSWTVTGQAPVTLTLQGSNGALAPQNVTGQTSFTFKPTQTATYTLTAENALGTTEAALSVEVGQAPVIDSFRASEQEVAAGTPVILSWQVRGAQTLRIDPVGPVTGTQLSVTPSQTTAYILRAVNAFGETSAEVTVTVGAPPTITSFVATPSTVVPGQSTVLSWSVEGEDTRLFLSNGLGEVTGRDSLTVRAFGTVTLTLVAVNRYGRDRARTVITVDTP